MSMYGAHKTGHVCIRQVQVHGILRLARAALGQVARDNIRVAICSWIVRVSQVSVRRVTP